MTPAEVWSELEWLARVSRFVRRVPRHATAGRFAFAVTATILVTAAYATVVQQAAVEVRR